MASKRYRRREDDETEISSEAPGQLEPDPPKAEEPEKPAEKKAVRHFGPKGPTPAYAARYR